jgi:hypothetical protein
VEASSDQELVERLQDATFDETGLPAATRALDSGPVDIPGAAGEPSSSYTVPDSGEDDEVRLWQAPDECSSSTLFDMHLMESWHTTFSIPAFADVEGHSQGEIQYRNVLWEILYSEAVHISNMQRFLSFFMEELQSSKPRVVEEPSRFVAAVIQGYEGIRRLHRKFLYRPLLADWEMGGPRTKLRAETFLTFLDACGQVYSLHCLTFAHREFLMDREIQTNAEFRAFVERAEKGTLEQQMGLVLVLHGTTRQIAKVRPFLS